MEKKVTFKINSGGLKWPYYRGEKAWSPSSLVEILKLIEYEDKQIPEIILQKAAQRGKIFHQAIQEFVQTGKASHSKDSPSICQKIQETIGFLQTRKTSFFQKQSFLASEKLHYTFHKNILIATYVDLEFSNCVIELKANNIKMYQSPLTLLAFQIQLLIQHLCTQKAVYLLWSTGQGVIFHRFKISPELLEILDILIDIGKKKDTYTPTKKRAMVEKILLSYTPQRLTNFS